jgi:uncharacterized membrane protein
MSEGLLAALIELLPFEAAEIALVVFCIFGVALLVTVAINIAKRIGLPDGWAGYVNTITNVCAQISLPPRLSWGSLVILGLTSM